MTRTRTDGGRNTEKALRALLPDRDPEIARLLFSLTRLGRINEHILGQVTSRYGLDTSESAVLSILWLAGPPHRLSPTVLSRRLVQTSGGMTSTLRRLTNRGLVTRDPDPEDRRCLLVALTGEGREVAEESLDGIIRSYEAMFADLDDGEREQIAVALRMLLDRFEAQAGLVISAPLYPGSRTRKSSK